MLFKWAHGELGQSRGKAQIQESTLASGDMQRVGTSNPGSIILQTRPDCADERMKDYAFARSVLWLLLYLSRYALRMLRRLYPESKCLWDSLGSSYVAKATLCLGAGLQHSKYRR